MNPAPEKRRLGEYHLKQLLAQNSISFTWLAEQTSVSRMVLVDELRAEKDDLRETFLADIRVKASIDHPRISSVYEAVSEPGICFYAYELLPGDTLAGWGKSGATVEPLQLAHIVRRIAEAHVQHEILGHATSPLSLDAVHVDEHGVIRLSNLAIAGFRSADQSARDIVHLGDVLVPLVAEGRPGATRMFTLFGWMRGEEVGAPITWEETRDVCVQIEHQLDGLHSSLESIQVASHPPKSHAPRIVLGTAVILLGIGILAFKMRPPVAAPPPRVSLPAPRTVAAGKHLTPDGTEGTLPQFRISAHEITIGQYAEFLETLGMLEKNQQEHIFNHPDQIPEKISHEPTAWSALFAAAKSQGAWHNQAVTLDSPVVGIDWWDAFAYAAWKKARLPTQEEWFAALHLGGAPPALLPTGLWVPVTSQTVDRTPPGMIGMAGSVAEWTASLGTNPANPLGDRRWVIIGGSFLKTDSNALTREWTLDRSLRRPDLGFRIVFDAE